MKDAERPADAYELVASMLHPAYFYRSPPLNGVEVFVAGLDGVVTRWCVHASTANTLATLVAHHPDLQLRGARPYTPHTPIGDTTP